MQVVHGKGGTVQSAWFEWACVHTFTPPYSGFEPKGDACKVMRSVIFLTGAPVPTCIWTCSIMLW